MPDPVSIQSSFYPDTPQDHLEKQRKKKGKDMNPPAGRAGGISNPAFDMTFYVAYDVVY